MTGQMNGNDEGKPSRHDRSSLCDGLQCSQGDN